MGDSKPIWWLITLRNSDLDVQEPIQVEACDVDSATKIAGQLISGKWSVLHAEPFQDWKRS